MQNEEKKTHTNTLSRLLDHIKNKPQMAIIRNKATQHTWPETKMRDLHFTLRWREKWSEKKNVGSWCRESSMNYFIHFDGERERARRFKELWRHNSWRSNYTDPRDKHPTLINFNVYTKNVIVLSRSCMYISLVKRTRCNLCNNAFWRHSKNHVGLPSAWIPSRHICRPFPAHEYFSLQQEKKKKKQ